MTAVAIHHARAAAPFASRGALSAALGWWRSEPERDGEWLLVPTLRIVASPAANRTAETLAREVDRALASLRDTATVDPPPGRYPPGPLRFTTPERWFAWLAAELAAPMERLANDRAPLPGLPDDLRAALRNEALTEPTRLLAIARSLIAHRAFESWAGGWGNAEIEQVARSCAAGFGIAPEHAMIALARSTGSALFAIAELPSQPASASRQAALTVIEAAAALADLPHRPTGHRFIAHLLAAVALRPQLAVPMTRAIALRHFAADIPPVPGAGDGPRPALSGPRLAAASTLTPVPEKSVAATPEDAARQPPPRGGTSTACSPRRPGSGRSSPAPAEVGAERPLVMAEGTFAAFARAQAEEAGLPAGAPPSHAVAAQLRPGPHAAFASHFAGLLFVLNALTALGFYPDFTRPLDSRLAPSPGWLLAQLGRRWFGRRFGRDRLCGWLEATGLPGALPLRWHSPQGLEAPLRRRHRPVWRASQRRRARVRNNRNARWIDALARLLEWRLREAGTDMRDLRLAGQIVDRIEKVEARFALIDLPLSLRIAGLDRDPGWLPAEGRAFVFTFA